MSDSSLKSRPAGGGHVAAHRPARSGLAWSALFQPFPSGKTPWVIRHRFVFLLDLELSSLLSYLVAVKEFSSPAPGYRRAKVYAGTSDEFLARQTSIRSSGLILQRLRCGDLYPDEFRRAMCVLDLESQNGIIQKIPVYNQIEHNSHYRKVLGRISPFYLSPALTPGEVLGILEAASSL